MSRRKFALILSVLTHLVVSTPAYAQESTVRELNARGLEAFGEGRFSDAAESFDRAYALEPRPELLKNEAVAWYKAERCEEAVEAAHQYLGAPELAPADRDEISALLNACKVKLAGEAIEAGSLSLAERLLDEVEASSPDAVLADRAARVRIELARARKEQGTRTNDTSDASDVGAVAMDASADDDTPTGRQDASHDTAFTRVEDPGPARGSAVGWPLIGLGAASLAGAVVYHVVMATTVEPSFHDAARAGTDRERYDRLDRTLRTANVLVPTLYGIGAASTAVGVWMVARSPGARETVALVGVSGAF